MILKALLIVAFWPSMLLVECYGSVSVPFTHEFQDDLCGWDLKKNWFWSVHDFPDTSHLPTFSMSGNIVYTQKHITEDFNNDMSFTLFNVTGVKRTTTFTFKYWFYTRYFSGTHGLYFYLMDFSKEGTYLPIKIIQYSESKWNYLMIDCEREDCCQDDECNLQIQVIGSIGKEDDYGIASLSCVSTELNGCGVPPDVKTTTRVPNTPTQTTGASPLNSLPNIFAMTSFVFISLIVRPLSS